MFTDKLVTFFLPAKLRRDKTHTQYTEFYLVANACVFGLLLVLAGAGLMQYFRVSALGFYGSAAVALLTLLSMKWLGHYRLPLSLNAGGGLAHHLRVHSAHRNVVLPQRQPIVPVPGDGAAGR